MPTIYGPVTYGDTSGALADHARAGAQNLHGDSVLNGQTLVGDANALLAHAIGGDDTLVASNERVTLVGDAFTISGHAQGGDDHITASGEFSESYGDAFTLAGHARGGNDTIQVNGLHGPAVGVGDASQLIDSAVGGNDTITGTGSRTFVHLYGDAETMGGHTRGGDDVVTVFQGTMYGDARILSGHARGGDDLLIGGSTFPTGPGGGVMYGDGEQLLDHAAGGNDTLVSGHYTNDIMYGDAATVGPHATTGDDLFVFAPENGEDQIMDFQPGKDHIELKGFGFTSYADVAAHFQPVAQGTLITFGAFSDILVRGISTAQLSSGDFILTT